MSRAALRRLCPLLVIVLLAWLVPATANAAPRARASSFRGNAACNLLDYAGMAPEVLNGKPGSLVFGSGYCHIGRCWQHATDPNNPEQKICHYARGAILNLRIDATAKQALATVRRSINRGYRREKLRGAALAGFIVSSKGAAVVMAVDNTAVLFSFGATSDDDPNPTWGDAGLLIHSAARDIAKGLARPGCPEHPLRCPGSVSSP